MENLFVEGDKTSKRVRLNQSEVYGYGTRNPTWPPTPSEPGPSKPKWKRGAHGRPGGSPSRSQTGQILTIMQELLQETNTIANEVSKMKSGQDPGSGRRDDRIWQELANIRQNLENLNSKWSGNSQYQLQPRGQSGAAEELLSKARRTLEQVKLTVTSMQSPSPIPSSRNQASRNAYTAWKPGQFSHSTPINYYQSSAFTAYRTQPLIPPTPPPKFSFRSTPFLKFDLVENQSQFQNVTRSQPQAPPQPVQPNYTPDPFFSTRPPRVFGKRKSPETSINDRATSYRAEMKSMEFKKMEKKKQGPEPMDFTTTE